MDEHDVEFFDSEDVQLVLDVGQHACLGIIGTSLAVAAPFRSAMAAQASTDDDFVTFDDPLLDGHTELADGIAVAPCTVEMIDSSVDGRGGSGRRILHR